MMWSNYMTGYGQWETEPYFWWMLIPLSLLDLILKGFALYRSARNKQNVWFIFLLIVNSAGILPAIYLLTNKEKKTKK